jgi:hypothetical protein
MGMSACVTTKTNHYSLVRKVFIDENVIDC